MLELDERAPLRGGVEGDGVGEGAAEPGGELQVVPFARALAARDGQLGVAGDRAVSEEVRVVVRGGCDQGGARREGEHDRDELYDEDGDDQRAPQWSRGSRVSRCCVRRWS